MTGNGAGGRGEGRLPALPSPSGPRRGGRRCLPAGRLAGWELGWGWGGGLVGVSSLPPARPFPGRTSGPGARGGGGSAVSTGKRAVRPPPPPPRSRVELGGDGEGPAPGNGGTERGGGAVITAGPRPEESILVKVELRQTMRMGDGGGEKRGKRGSGRRGPGRQGFARSPRELCPPGVVWTCPARGTGGLGGVRGPGGGGGGGRRGADSRQILAVGGGEEAP